MSSSSTVVPPAVAALPADLDAGLRRLKLATVRRTAAEVLQTAKTWALDTGGGAAHPDRSGIGRP